jgi:type IV pilus assembly protein PilA
MLKGRQGFTLIELLIVVVIIGILAAIAIPKFSATREKAFVASMKADLRNLATQQDLYYSGGAWGSYFYADDAADPDLGFSASEGVTVEVEAAGSDGWSATAIHDGLVDKEVGCAVFHGDDGYATATPYGTAADISGVIVCDPLS